MASLELYPSIAKMHQSLSHTAIRGVSVMNKYSDTSAEVKQESEFAQHRDINKLCNAKPEGQFCFFRLNPVT